MEAGYFDCDFNISSRIKRLASWTLDMRVDWDSIKTWLISFSRLLQHLRTQLGPS